MNIPADEGTTWLYLVRHGATDSNLHDPPVLQGKSVDLPLNERGRQQAAAASRFLRRFPVHHVYASPMRRAVETAEVIAEPHGCPVRTVPKLVEADVGEWEGKDWGTIMRDDAERYRAFMEDPGRHPYRGGESYGDVLRRVQPEFQRLLEQHSGETIVVVAHNVVNRVYLAHLLGLELKFAKGIRQNNTGINLIRHRRGETELMTLNAHFHLQAPV